VINSLLKVPVVPAWGKAFLGNKCFKHAVWEAHQRFPNATKIMLVVAGNDLWWNSDPIAIAEEMDGLQHYWRQAGVDLVYINVVPRSHHVY